jgi:undecaprenyl-diphosphatase
MWEALLEWDQELFLWLNGLGSPGWDEFWLMLSDKWTAIPLYLLLLIVAFRQFGGKRTLILLVFIALLITCTDQLANFFKYGIGRLRPCHDTDIGSAVRLVKASCGGRFGFFSAHAANAFGVAAFFVVLWGRKHLWWGTLLLFWAILVGYSRIYLGVHFPLDVISGFIAGGFLGWIFARLYVFALQKWMGN